MTTREWTIISVAVGAIGVVIALAALLLTSSGESVDSQSQSSLIVHGDIGSESESGDSSSKSSSQVGDVSGQSSSIAESGDSVSQSSSGGSVSESQSSGGDASSKIQNNANQNITVVVNDEDDPDGDGTIGPPQDGTRSDSAGNDGASSEQEEPVSSTTPLDDVEDEDDATSGSTSGQPSNRDLGHCRAGLQVGVGQRCSVAGQQQPFEVHEAWAWSPWDRRSSDDYNYEAIKVDEGDPVAGGVTFQARRQISEAWTILVSSPWRDLGGCSRDRLVRAGEYCIEQRSGAPFLVYATDELNTGETRPLYLDGYAVLFWFGSGTPDPANGLLHDQQVRSGDHFLAEVARDGLWRIVRAD